MKRKLPIGIQTFREIREDGCYYVDKTPHAKRLADEGKHYFLSRPRRFGKSLFLDTLKELFAGNEALFRGLYVHDKWNWSVRHPVLRLSFGGGDFKQPGYLQEDVADQLEVLEERMDVRSHPTRPPPVRFRRLIEASSERAGQRAVVLVDEYDKPILDALDVPHIARANRDFLRGLYGTVKDCDAHIRLSFLTGVSKFSRVSLFSGLNNLEDITMAPTYSSVCGYTEADLDAVFGPELPGLDRDRTRRWYNGYNWLGEENVYNPFDILLLFRTRRFDAHWFRTGTPKFLIDTLIGRRIETPALDGMLGSDELLSAFDVDDMATEALLFQTGYLTIKEVIEEPDGTSRYRLGYPNHEVSRSLNESLLRALAPTASLQLAGSERLRELLERNDFAGMRELIESWFDGIPYEWHMNNDIARYEGYYASVFYSLFAAMGLDVVPEDSSARGRADMTLRFNDQVYIFEFKVTELAGEGSALAQLKDRGYANKYRRLDQPIHLIGVEFSRGTRTLAVFDVEPV